MPRKYSFLVLALAGLVTACSQQVGSEQDWDDDIDADSSSANLKDPTIVMRMSITYRKNNGARRTVRREARVEGATTTLRPRRLNCKAGTQVKITYQLQTGGGATPLCSDQQDRCDLSTYRATCAGANRMPSQNRDFQFLILAGGEVSERRAFFRPRVWD